MNFPFFSPFNMQKFEMSQTGTVTVAMCVCSCVCVCVCAPLSPGHPQIRLVLAAHAGVVSNLRSPPAYFVLGLFHARRTGNLQT